MSILRFYGLLNDRYPDRVTFQDLFDNPSLREIARLVEGPLEPPPAAGAEILEF